MGRFHLSCAIILFPQEYIQNSIILESLYHFVSNVNMDIYTDLSFFPSQHKLKQKNIKFFNTDLHTFNLFKDTNYKFYIFFPFYNYTMIHPHLPQYLYFLNLSSNPIYHVKFTYLSYRNKKKKFQFIQDKHEIFHITSDKSLVNPAILFDNHLLHDIDTSNFGLFKNFSHKLNDIYLLFYKTFIYKCKYIVRDPDFLIDYFTHSKPFTFIRIGDGEIHCIHTDKTLPGIYNHNRNGCNFQTKGLSDSILEIINDESLVHQKNIFIAWNPSVIRNRYDCFQTFNKFFTNYNMTFLIDHTILIKKLINDPSYFSAFLKSIHVSSSYIIYVGPKYMNSHLNPIKFNKYITIPEQNCFEKREIIFENIVSSFQNKSIVFFSGGLGIKNIIYKLYLQYGKKHSFFDIGSVLDPFFDLWSRRTFLKNKSTISSNISEINSFIYHPQLLSCRKD